MSTTRTVADLIRAAQNNDCGLAKECIETFHISPDETDSSSSHKDTPLIWAVYNGKLEVARYLVSQGASILKTNSSNATCLDYCVHNHPLFLELLDKAFQQVQATPWNIDLLDQFNKILEKYKSKTTPGLHDKYSFFAIDISLWKEKISKITSVNDKDIHCIKAIEICLVHDSKQADDVALQLASLLSDKAANADAWKIYTEAIKVLPDEFALIWKLKEASEKGLPIAKMRLEKIRSRSQDSQAKLFANMILALMWNDPQFSAAIEDEKAGPKEAMLAGAYWKYFHKALTAQNPIDKIYFANQARPGILLAGKTELECLEQLNRPGLKEKIRVKFLELGKRCNETIDADFKRTAEANHVFQWCTQKFESALAAPQPMSVGSNSSAGASASATAASDCKSSTAAVACALVPDQKSQPLLSSNFTRAVEAYAGRRYLSDLMHNADNYYAKADIPNAIHAIKDLLDDLIQAKKIAELKMYQDRLIRLRGVAVEDEIIIIDEALQKIDDVLFNAALYSEEEKLKATLANCQQANHEAHEAYKSAPIWNRLQLSQRCNKKAEEVSIAQINLQNHYLQRAGLLEAKAVEVGNKGGPAQYDKVVQYRKSAINAYGLAFEAGSPEALLLLKAYSQAPEPSLPDSKKETCVPQGSANPIQQHAQSVYNRLTRASTSPAYKPTTYGKSA